MINRVARTVQPLLLLRNTHHFAKFGNPRDRKKSDRNPFFKDKKNEEKDSPI
jgi:hypothetical protein